MIAAVLELLVGRGDWGQALTSATDSAPFGVESSGEVIDFEFSNAWGDCHSGSALGGSPPLLRVKWRGEKEMGPLLSGVGRAFVLGVREGP